VVEQLEERAVPSIGAVGSGPGIASTVAIIDETGKVIKTLNPFPASFTGGVHVALGDMNGDGIPEIVAAAGAGGGPQVNVYDGQTFQLLHSFYAYSPGFTGGVNVALGNLHADGVLDLITSAGAGGGPQVNVYDGDTGAQIAAFYGLPSTFTGGLQVAVADLDASQNRVSDIVVAAGAGGGPQVTAFDPFTLNPVMSFYAEPSSFSGGLNIASADLAGTGFVDLVVGAGAGGLPQVSTYGLTSTGVQALSSFFAFNGSGSSGVEVGSLSLGLQSDVTIPDGIAVARQHAPGLSMSDLQQFQLFSEQGKLLQQGTLPVDADLTGDALSGNESYTGPVYRGINYSPTWPGEVPGQKNTQQQDSDFATDAFQSLWANQRMPLQASDTGSQLPGDPANGPNPMLPANTVFRDDLGTIAKDGFNLVRLYDWNPSRDWTGSAGVGHLNFLNYANSLKVNNGSSETLKVMVPVSDYFIGNNAGAWGNQAPLTSYAFDSSQIPASVQTSFNQFLTSITDPNTNKVHAAIQSIDVGNEPDLFQQTMEGATPAQYLSRIIWYIVNLNAKINGPGGINAGGPVIPITASFSNGDQGGSSSGLPSWFACLINGVQADTVLPLGAKPATGTFGSAVQGLKFADSAYTKYYFNSENVAQIDNSLAAAPGQGTVGLYDAGNKGWPGMKFNVPFMLTELFYQNRPNNGPSGQMAQASTSYNDQALVLEKYFTDLGSGSSMSNPNSKTQLMGYAWFEFNDEPAAGKTMGFYLNTSTFDNNQNTGVTQLAASNGQLYYFGDLGFGPPKPTTPPLPIAFPVYTLQAEQLGTPDPTLVGALQKLYQGK
jgi:hypothetical protein